MKLRIVVAAVLLSVLVLLAGCDWPWTPEVLETANEEVHRLIEIRGAIATMPSEASGPIFGTVGVGYCRMVSLLCSIPYETDVATVRWVFDGRQMPEWDDQISFPWNFQSTGIYNVKVTIVDEFDRTVVYDGEMRVVNPRSDYSNPWYTR